MTQSWDCYDTAMRQSWDSLLLHSTTPAAVLADLFVLVCSVRYPLMQQGGHKTMACLSGKGHGKKLVELARH